MKNTQKIATLVLAAALVGTALYLLRKKQHNKRREFVSNAGYEMAYDVHYPVKYRGESRSGKEKI
jgi:hypothetical protein